MEKEVNFEYDVKCRKCGKVTRMFFGTNYTSSKEKFKIWVKEHSTFPIEAQCECDRGMMMFHDIIGFGNVLDVL